ncbi:MAG: acetoacetate--CoA ligase [Pseudomonadota bacterium]|nr:acetoacetate--CoA ligase [Pseudomonadota bacterium]
MENVLWQPDQAWIDNTNMHRFMALVQARCGVVVDDYAALHRWSCEHSAAFWELVVEFCSIRLNGNPDRVVDDPCKLPGAKWYPQATLNFAENLLAPAGAADSAHKPALVFRGENGRRDVVTYQQLYTKVQRLAGFMQRNGVSMGDRVAAVMPNCIETVVGMLAATSLGAIWSSCSPDFGINGIVDRFEQIEPVMLIAVDGYHYAGKSISILDRVQLVQHKIPSIQNTILVPFLQSDQSVLQAEPAVQNLATTTLYPEIQRDDVPGKLEFTQVPFDHPLYIMYSSGTTGVPKCIVHTTGGTLLQHRKEHSLHADLKAEDVFFYFTTCGWMMWNWLISGLASGATLVLFDGSPFHPKASALIDMIDEEGISLFGTSAKYLSALEKAGVKPRESHQLSRLKGIFSTGSPLSHESFDYVYRDFKANLCLSSISGGTDIISCFALGNPVLPVARGELQCIGLGMDVRIFDEQGRAVVNEKGELVCLNAFPSCPAGFWNDADAAKFHGAYFDRFDGVWAHGDYGEITDRGSMIIYGRSDAVLNPGGVRIGTAEIYRQVEQLDFVLESVVVGQDWQDDVRVILFVRLKEGEHLDDEKIAIIKSTIRTNTTPRHVPAKIIQIADIPRTISGKIAELAVRKVIHGEAVKNTDALANPESLALYSNLEALQS